MDQINQQIEILLNQQRYKEAGELLAIQLVENPNSSHIHYQLSLVAQGLNDNTLALEHVENAIGIDPEDAYYFYQRAILQWNLDKFDEAEESINTSIVLEPGFSEGFSLWALIKIERKEYEEALELANECLRLDSSSKNGLNARSQALLKLNRIEESVDTISEALHDDPNNAFTHANFGWNLLEQSKPKEAMVHFQKALEIDPNLSFAQRGMKESIKSTNTIYRYFLKYSFWMSNKGASFQWGFIIGYFVLNKVFSNILINNPELGPILNPILYIMLAFALSTWFITPISNVLFRFHKYGNHLLTKNEKLNSNLVAGSFVIGIVGLIAYYTMNVPGFLNLTFMSIGLAIPFSDVFGKQNVWLKIAIGLLTLLGLLSIFIGFTLSLSFNRFGLYFVYGLLGYQFLRNKLVIDADNP